MCKNGQAFRLFTGSNKHDRRGSGGGDGGDGDGHGSAGTRRVLDCGQFLPS